MCTALAILTLGAIEPVEAQDSARAVFLLQPGIVTVNAVSAENESGSASGLNLRFLTMIPTGVPRTWLLLGASFAPLGLSNGRRSENAPNVFFGGAFRLLEARETSGWLTVELPVLGSYRFDDAGESDREYVTNLVAQGSMTVHVGRALMSDLGSFWSRFTLFAFAEQNLTPAGDAATGKRDRFTPVFHYGVSIPLARM